MADTKFESDPRIPCKYGEKCYQKNPTHHEKYKHKAKIVTKTEGVNKRKSDEPVENTSKKRHTEKASSAEDEPDGEPETQVDECHDDEDVDLPASPQSIRENIKQKFLTDMPDDFFSFWEFCKSLNSAHPEDAMKDCTGLQLVGPYDVLSGKIVSLKNRKLSSYLTYYRYYYDPPEFQTIVKGCDETQHHFGYFRDSPDELPVFVAENEAKKGCTIRPIGENIFAAVSSFIESKISTKNKDEQLEKLQDALQKWAKKSKFSLEKNTVKMKARNRKVVTKSFHGAGIVVPYDKKTEAGYRELPENDGQLKKIMQSVVSCKTQEEKDKKFDHIQEIITLIQFANDERDYGMGLELAIDLFCFGDPYFHSTISCMLPLAYELLQRPQFAKITQAHLRKRSKSLP